jgi:hypothetical protein
MEPGTDEAMIAEDVSLWQDCLNILSKYPLPPGSRIGVPLVTRTQSGVLIWRADLDIRGLEQLGVSRIMCLRSPGGGLSFHIAIGQEIPPLSSYTLPPSDR